MEYFSDLVLCIIYLFFAKAFLHKVFKLNYQILLINCIYKTNVYRMPLYIIIRVTPINTTYYVGFAFFTNEKVEDYRWILQYVKQLYEVLDISNPSVIITDADFAIIPAVLEKCSLSCHLLY